MPIHDTTKALLSAFRRADIETLVDEYGFASPAKPRDELGYIERAVYDWHAAGYPDAPPLPKPEYSLTQDQIGEVALEMERVAALHGMPESAGPLTRDEVLRFLANASALLIVLDRTNPT